MSNHIRDENLIAYCGLYCGDCHAYHGRIAELARDLRRELRKSKYDKFAQFISQHSLGKNFEHYDKCYKTLGTMVKFICKRGCRAGGGSPQCRIRRCCQNRAIEGCWDCLEFEVCEELDLLHPVHGDAHIKNLQVIRKKGKVEFLKGNRFW